MKIMQIITGLYPAGAERIVASLSKGLKQAGHEVAVVSLQPLPESSPLVNELKEQKIPISSLNITQLSPWRMFRLKSKIKEFSPEIVHSHLIHANLVSRLGSGKKDFQLVNTVHIAERRPGKWWHFCFDKWTLKGCDVQTAVSKAVRDFHAGKIGMPSEKMPVIHNGIVFPESPGGERIEELRQEWGVEGCAKVIGSVGRLDWQKGYDLLLQLLPELGRKIPEGETWGLVILGEGKERGKLAKLSERASKNIVVNFPGYRQDADHCIGAFDLFVMPSRYEGFGLSLIEAMSHGIPVLASNVDSLPELLEGYGNGKCVDFAGEGVVEEVINSLTKERVEWESSLNVDQMVKEYLELYRSLTDD